MANNLSHDPTQTSVAKVIEWSVKNPLIISILALVILVGGIFAVQRTPLDAIPDLSDVQVIVYTDWEGRSPDLIEDQITYPVSSKFIAAPKVKLNSPVPISASAWSSSLIP